MTPESPGGGGWELLLHSMATPETDAAGCLRVAGRLGLDGVELIVDDDYPAALAVSATARQRAKLLAEARALGLRVPALCSYVRAIDSESASLRRAAADELRRTVDLAVDLGATQIRVLAGGHAGDGENAPGRDAAAWRAARTLHAVGRHADAAGVNLNIENHMNTLATSASATVALAEAAASPAVGILYDQANLAIMGAEAAAEAVASQRPFIRHVHLKNFVPAGADRRPVGLAAGVVDWDRTLRLLAGYSGAMTFEYERRWYPRLPPAALGLPPDRDLVRRVHARLLAPNT